MCPNASIMPSLARTRLATANSWRSSANESGMAGSLRQVSQRTGSSEWRIASSKLRMSRSPVAIRGGGCSYQAHPILPRRSANLSLTFCRSSGLARATMGKSARRSNGRQASMMARELVELALSSIGSSGPLQVRRTNSMSFGRIAARAHRPHHVEQVGRIDILVDHDDEAPEIGGRLAAGRQQPRLARMAGIGLLDGDDVEHARAAEFVHPHAGDPGQARALDLVPDHAGLHHAFAEGEIGRRAHRRGDAEDRIVAIIDALDLHQRLLARARGVITRELAERSFLRLHVLDHLAFEHDLGMRRHRQTVKLAQHDLVRLTAVAAGIVVFAKAELELVAAGEE